MKITIAGLNDVFIDEPVKILWTGMGLLIILFQVYHLFWPLNGRAAIVFGLVGLGGCIVYQEELGRIEKVSIKCSPVLLLGCGIVGILLAGRALGSVGFAG